MAKKIETKKLYNVEIYFSNGYDITLKGCTWDDVNHFRNVYKQQAIAKKLKMKFKYFHVRTAKYIIY